MKPVYSIWVKSLFCEQSALQDQFISLVYRKIMAMLRTTQSGDRPSKSLGFFCSAMENLNHSKLSLNVLWITLSWRHASGIWTQVMIVWLCPLALQGSSQRYLNGGCSSLCSAWVGNLFELKFHISPLQILVWPHRLQVCTLTVTL